MKLLLTDGLDLFFSCIFYKLHAEHQLDVYMMWGTVLV